MELELQPYQPGDGRVLLSLAIGGVFVIIGVVVVVVSFPVAAVRRALGW
jgi:hypothetical protein